MATVPVQPGRRAFDRLSLTAADSDSPSDADSAQRQPLTSRSVQCPVWGRHPLSTTSTRKVCSQHALFSRRLHHVPRELAERFNQPTTVSLFPHRAMKKRTTPVRAVPPPRHVSMEASLLPRFKPPTPPAALPRSLSHPLHPPSRPLPRHPRAPPPLPPRLHARREAPPRRPPRRPPAFPLRLPPIHQGVPAADEGAPRGEDGGPRGRRSGTSGRG